MADDKLTYVKQYIIWVRIIQFQISWRLTSGRPCSEPWISDCPRERGVCNNETPQRHLRHLVSFIFDIIESALAGHVVSKSQVPTHIDCAFECLSSQRCVSYNYEEGNKALHECELNSETKESKPTNLTGKAGHSYYGTGRNVSNSCSSWEILLNVTFTTLSLSLSPQASWSVVWRRWPWQQG